MDTYRNTPSFICFPSLDATAPAPLASTHCRLVVRDAVWHNSPSVASTSPIFRRSEIVTFVTTASRRDGHRCCSIKMCRNDRICNRIQLLSVIYMGVGVGGRVSPSSASALSYSSIFHLKASFSVAVIFSIELFEASVSVPDRAKKKGAGTAAINDLVGFREENVSGARPRLPVVIYLRVHKRIVSDECQHLLGSSGCSFLRLQMRCFR